MYTGHSKYIASIAGLLTIAHLTMTRSAICTGKTTRHVKSFVQKNEVQPTEWAAIAQLLQHYFLFLFDSIKLV